MNMLFEEAAPAEGPRPKILLVDEQDSRRAAVTSLLEKDGYEVVLGDPQHVLQQARDHCPFLVVLGVSEGDGQMHQLLQTVKTADETRALPVYLVGGSAEEPEFSMGTVGMFEQGLSRNDLLDMIAHGGRMMPKARLEIPTVLVVDDDASVRDFLKETLVAEGYRVLLAASGQEGVQLAIEREPDLIILDLMMPGMSGFEVVHLLQQHPTASDIPVVVYTAKDLSRDEALLLGNEVERILIKGASGRSEILRQLQKLELMYPVQAHLMDSKLQCYNKRYLTRRLAQEVANAARHRQYFSLLSWEIDDFASYIKKHGARWGLVALKEVVDLGRVHTTAIFM